MTDEPQGTEVVRREDVEIVNEGGRFDLSRVDDPTAGLETAEKLVRYMDQKCTGDDYIATIQGKQYPKVDWWTTVGGGLGLFPREESCRKLDRPNEVAYEATVGVYNGDQVVTRASAICSSKEKTWSNRDEYAIRSMAITRATGKAYRVGLSFLPVMAGLEPTPAEEMPQNGSNGAADTGVTCPDCGGPAWDNTDDERSSAQGGKWPNFKCKDTDDCGWVSWETDPPGDDGWKDDVEADVEDGPYAGPSRDAPTDPAGEALREAKKDCWKALRSLISDDKQMKPILQAYGELQVDDWPVWGEWMPTHFDQATQDFVERGMEVLAECYEVLDEAESQEELAV